MNKALAIVDDLPEGPLEEARLLEWSVGEVQIRLKLADIDRLGCLLERAELKLNGGIGQDIDPASVARMFTYLGESLALIEHAKDEGRAILRSSPPLHERSQIQYYELVVDHREGLFLARYLYDFVTRERTSVPAPLTTYALSRLIDDFKRLAAEIGTKAQSR